ncbi:LemA family protein [Dermatophilus congolensis]|uniref:LemA family protein n=1 Tax=Dermatophilus congolensis TaxID=1863 RepID=UPI001AAEFA37|nr:LemA family protein [Dermatophilus congolensis]MBO3143457.1 LemA family protein [Dermatophilus congolensis]MBO3152447.1 LemA family protein [Dermatophilus congolensis]MBO3160541.1 LemA family protein [Dermatophilus congolensis]MBO3163734.1 LemA family protein [Dermatophilus congolensis]MBO3177280.1 LemA family protein [Dermatophilus congolensis]
MVVLLLLILIVVGVVVYGISTNNKLMQARNLTEESWRQIDVELKRRHDLIPNLVETVKGYAAHEGDTLQQVIEARNKAVSAGPSAGQATQAEGELSSALGRLMSISEAYPDLKANNNFTELQRELSATEDRIASGRRYYNATVRDLNTMVDSFPSSFFAKRAGVAKADYFEAETAAKNAPTINFGQGGGTIAGPGQGGPAAAQPAPQPPAVGTQQPGQLSGYDPNQGLGQNYTPSPIQDKRPGEQ